MRYGSIAPVVAAGVALAAGVGVAVVIDGGAQDASAAANFRATPQQLRINQRISKVAVLRTNANKTAIDALQATQATVAAQPRGLDPSKVVRLVSPDVRVFRGLRVEVRCPDGNIAIGGGHRLLSGAAKRLSVPVSLPGGALASWVTRFHHVQTANEPFARARAFAVCVAP